MPDRTAPPLIVTLTLDLAAQGWFDAIRSAYFPADRLFVGAHVTLFHALPGEREAEIAGHIGILCQGLAPFTVEVCGLRFLGRGVAYALRSPEAARWRMALGTPLHDALSPQDRAAWSPHVTVQNKVSPSQARATLAALATTAAPPAVLAQGVALWRYRGGPWQAAGAWPFGSTG